MNLIHQIKEERMLIDKEIKTLRRLRSVEEGRGDETGRALSLSITKLEEAKMWLGKALGGLEHPLPEEYRDEYKEPGLLERPPNPSLDVDYHERGF